MNTKFNSTEEILDYAIDKEEEAAEFYSKLAKKPLAEDISLFSHGTAKRRIPALPMRLHAFAASFGRKE
jgi:hypothetical protein